MKLNFLKVLLLLTSIFFFSCEEEDNENLSQNCENFETLKITEPDIKFFKSGESKEAELKLNVFIENSNNLDRFEWFIDGLALEDYVAENTEFIENATEGSFFNVFISKNGAYDICVKITSPFCPDTEKQVCKQVVIDIVEDNIMDTQPEIPCDKIDEEFRFIMVGENLDVEEEEQEINFESEDTVIYTFDSKGLLIVTSNLELETEAPSTWTIDGETYDKAEEFSGFSKFGFVFEMDENLRAKLSKGSTQQICYKQIIPSCDKLVEKCFTIKIK